MPATTALSLSRLSALAVLLMPTILPAAAEDPRLAVLLERFPDADANSDGVLTEAEAIDFLAKRRGGNKEQNPAIFEPSAADFQAAIEGGKALAFPKTDDGSLRLAMTGHSWVAPGIATLPPLAEAAGYAGHRQVTHTGGGGTGSANAIWLKEFGKWQDGVAAKPTLIPAINTGEWDVMTWGPFLKDEPKYYTQWIDFCLEHNPKTAFYLQDAWPRFDPSYVKLEDTAIIAAIAGEHAFLQKELFQPLYETFEESHPGKVRVIPVAAALVDLMQRYAAGEVAHLNCIDEAKKEGEGKIGFYRDGGHLSRSSGIEHLVGYGYFSMLYRRSPATVEGYAPKGVPPAFDAQMRDAIWKAVVASPFAGIDDADGDGMAD